VSTDKALVESAIQKQYDSLARVYDLRWRRYLSDTLTFFKEWADIPPTATVLDVACGTGELVRLLLQDHPNQMITGIDISEQMVVQASQKFEGFVNVSFKNAPVSDLPFSSESFDVVVSANAFHYFSDPSEALTEIFRVLKPGGRVIILDWCKDFLLCRICDLVLQWLDPAHRQCYTEAELCNYLDITGFQVERSQRVRFGIFWGLMAVSAAGKSV
jgi:ubiquinone/menaquinone biosynthesis C-methylase UbiE